MNEKDLNKLCSGYMVVVNIHSGKELVGIVYGKLVKFFDHVDGTVKYAVSNDDAKIWFTADMVVLASVERVSTGAVMVLSVYFGGRHEG